MAVQAFLGDLQLEWDSTGQSGVSNGRVTFPGCLAMPNVSFVAVSLLENERERVVLGNLGDIIGALKSAISAKLE